MISNPSPAVTSLLDSFQSSFRSISWKDSCDLGPFLISSTSMMKVSVLSGGILPDREEGRHKKKKRGQNLQTMFSEPERSLNPQQSWRTTVKKKRWQSVSKTCCDIGMGNTEDTLVFALTRRFRFSSKAPFTCFMLWKPITERNHSELKIRSHLKQDWENNTHAQHAILWG